MSSGKSTRFFYIIIFTLVVGGISIFLDKLGVLEIGLFESSRPIITPEELCELFQSDEDEKAGILIENNYEEVENKKEGAIYYKKGGIANEERIWIKVYSNQPAYTRFWATFNKKKDYVKFVKYIEENYKVNFSKDKHYNLSNECSVINLGYYRGAEGYQIVIDKASH